jgi:hypothetical protein
MDAFMDATRRRVFGRQDDPSCAAEPQMPIAKLDVPVVSHSKVRERVMESVTGRESVTRESVRAGGVKEVQGECRPGAAQRSPPGQPPSYGPRWQAAVTRS